MKMVAQALMPLMMVNWRVKLEQRRLYQKAPENIIQVSSKIMAGILRTILSQALK